MQATFRVEVKPGQAFNPPYVAKLDRIEGSEYQYKRKKFPIRNIQIENTPDNPFQVFINEMYEVEEGDTLEIQGNWIVNGKRLTGNVFGVEDGLIRCYSDGHSTGYSYINPNPDNESTCVSLFPVNQEDIVEVVIGVSAPQNFPN